MSKEVKVDTKLSAKEYGYLALGVAAVGGLTYGLGGTKIDSAFKALSIVSLTLLALLLWLLLTGPGHLASLIENNQMIALIMACVIAATGFLNQMTIWGIQFGTK